MKVLKFFDNETIYQYPNGDVATPERILQDFPAAAIFTHVIETDPAGQVCYAVENFSALRSLYDIDDSLSDEEARVVIQEIINTEPEVSTSNETRIADALEDLVVLNMPDEEVE